MDKNLSTLDISLALGGGNKPYLGDLQTVTDIVETAISAAYAAIVDNPLAPGGKLKEIAESHARIFLGENDEYQPMPGWNTPGAIDVFVAQESGINETTPIYRMATLFILAFSDVMGLIQLFDRDEISESDMREALAAGIESVATELMGIPANHE